MSPIYERSEACGKAKRKRNKIAKELLKKSPSQIIKKKNDDSECNERKK